MRRKNNENDIAAANSSVLQLNFIKQFLKNIKSYKLIWSNNIKIKLKIFI